MTVTDQLSSRLVPDELLDLVQPHLPKFRPRPQGGGTAHRRFSQWTKARAWPKIHRAVLDELGSQGLIDWSRAVADAACVRAKKGAP